MGLFVTRQILHSLKYCPTYAFLCKYTLTACLFSVTSQVGVRQGDNLSPLLFSLYLNDLESELCRKYKGLSILSDLIENKIVFDDIVVYLKLNSLLYADDTIIMAESKADLQTALNTLSWYIL